MRVACEYEHLTTGLVATDRQLPAGNSSNYNQRGSLTRVVLRGVRTGTDKGLSDFGLNRFGLICVPANLNPDLGTSVKRGIPWRYGPLVISVVSGLLVSAYDHSGPQFA